ncbi:hypothetical protein DSM106972_067890 [Dulcicalothrix desertica PCC 7102]|uniref:Circadian input-output histidine kinase CikA n=1 Tax=Dulcicalothrix desertica PCC 7102 TaxID=232991 RepID=A0A3S1D078_9CYAN|nr:ATP-binding protein [Dulcicalothrix desertica]RUT01238.1 hypothetical protein DSM106972_067890 [Dulcicalothrix desertica PCC 7102]TWH40610.1 PAS domain S-box-containing protein [Dulcicalothrix desertica PCC 7102]
MKSDEVEFLNGGGEMGERIRSFNWAATPLGDVKNFPQSLRSAISILLPSKSQIGLFWGQDFIKLYNDAFSSVLGVKHPYVLGTPARSCWSEIWETLEPLLNGVVETGEAFWAQDYLFLIDRSGYIEETYFDISYDPVRDESGGVGGVFCIVRENTGRVLGDRRLETLRDLAIQTAQTNTAEAACEQAAVVLSQNPFDISFALLYSLDADGIARRVGVTGIEPDLQCSPSIINVDDAVWMQWSLAQALSTGQPQIVTDLQTPKDDAIPNVVLGNATSRCNTAMVLPLTRASEQRPFGFLITGISPFRKLDAAYKDFLELVASSITTAIINARSKEEERQRAEALAELDRAKTNFFSNISHEFRTPLTLILGPLAQTLATAPELGNEHRQQLETVQRNGQRLLKLVNTLLDFSRIEAKRVQMNYEPTDVASLTAELASLFRSTIEYAGIRLIVNCPTLPEPVYVDRDSWEKIVLNLLSNAFKFTFSGEIEVSLLWAPTQVELKVRDTGIGIKESELSRLFEKFYRVQGAKGRNTEGSGIGLSLVQELVHLHGGTIDVSSVECKGTCFTVSIPTSNAHISENQIKTSTANSTTNASSYVKEALRWLPTKEESNQHLVSSVSNIPRILLADDNADMRAYIQRLLEPEYEVETVTDGNAAFLAALKYPPDLVLTDVMMPNLDGFGLLKALRHNPTTREIPIILLSARAGEESRIEGLNAGADDYLVKPFSARELLARVKANLELGQLRLEGRRISEARMLLALESAELGTWDYYPITGVLNWDERCKAMFGLAPDALVNYDIFLAGLHPEDRERTDKIVQQAMNPNGNGKYDIEYRTIGIQDDIERWIAAKGQAYFNREGEVVRFVGTVLDITQKKQAEVEREQLLKSEQAAREQAEAANRVKDEFLAVLSHELRTPLNPILGWLRLLQTKKLDSAKTTEALATIERNAKLQLRLVEDLLDISRIMRGKLSMTVAPTNLKSIIISATETVKLAAEAKQIQLVLHLNSIESVSGDAARLQQIVWNLLTNAIKFTPNGGKVTVTLRTIGNYAQIQIIDTGKGIKPDFLPYMFEYFRQEDSSTTRNFGGLGLGLAIVRQLVELHGGIIWAESPGENQGATFTVKLPIVKN